MFAWEPPKEEHMVWILVVSAVMVGVVAVMVSWRRRRTVR